MTTITVETHITDEGTEYLAVRKDGNLVKLFFMNQEEEAKQFADGLADKIRDAAKYTHKVLHTITVTEA